MDKNLCSAGWIINIFVHFINVYAIVKKCSQQKIFFKEINTFFSKDALNWSQLMVKTFIMWQKIYILNKCGFFILSIHQRILKKKKHSFQKILNNTTVFNNDTILEYQISILKWFQIIFLSFIHELAALFYPSWFHQFFFLATICIFQVGLNKTRRLDFFTFITFSTSRLCFYCLWCLMRYYSLLIFIYYSADK